jgi:hypothetical protein
VEALDLKPICPVGQEGFDVSSSDRKPETPTGFDCGQVFGPNCLARWVCDFVLFFVGITSREFL